MPHLDELLGVATVAAAGLFAAAAFEPLAKGAADADAPVASAPAAPATAQAARFMSLQSKRG